MFVTRLPRTITTRHVRTMAVPRLRELLAGLSLRRPAFDPRQFHVGFVVDEVALGQVPCPSTSGFPCHYNYTSTCQSPTQYNLGSWPRLWIHTCISSFRFVYRGHIKGKFNRCCQVFWVLCFSPVSAATVRASVCVRGYICVHAEISSDFWGPHLLRTDSYWHSCFP